MILINEPVQPGVRMAFREEVRAVRGRPTFSASGKAPGSWIDLSPVTAIPLAGKVTDDGELANFIAAERHRFRYDYVRLRCSFYPVKGEKFETAWLEVSLVPSEPVASDPPVAWSMQPGSEYENVEITDSAKLGAKFKFLSSEVSESAKGHVKLYSIRGYREGRPRAFWEMQTTDLAELNGSFAFHLVVRSPNTIETRGAVKLSTVIEARRFWVFHSEHAHGEEPVQTFVLPAISAKGKGHGE